jgi:diguanylate cyclase (GGDEF)-like protein
MARAAMDEHCHMVFQQATSLDLNSCIQVIEIESFPELVDRYGPSAGDSIIERMSERLSGVIRDGDTIGQIGDARFVVCVATVRQLSLELCI